MPPALPIGYGLFFSSRLNAHANRCRSAEHGGQPPAQLVDRVAQWKCGGICFTGQEAPKKPQVHFFWICFPAAPRALRASGAIVPRAHESASPQPAACRDNGPPAIAKDFKECIRISGMKHVRTHPCYPLANGKLERVQATIMGECIRPGVPFSLGRRLDTGGKVHCPLQQRPAAWHHR